LLKKVTELLGDDFKDTVADWIKYASIKGTEELQPFINAEGDFDYVRIPSEQIVYITDTTYQKNVEQVIRYYAMEIVKNGKVKELKRVEVWDKEKVTRYQEEEDGLGDTQYDFIVPGTYGIQLNPEYHWYSYNTNFTDSSQLNSFNDVDAVGVEGHSWGRVPMVSLANNSELRSDLVPIKRYVDALDVVSSGFVNDLRDIQLAIWVLRGYDGESLGDFMLNLQKFKAIKLDADDNASAEPKTMEIPKEARATMMEWLEHKIYEVGQAVDEQKITGGSITNVVIKAMYEGLNIKANQMITKLRKAMSEFMYFAVMYINNRDNTSYNYKDIEVEFNTNMLFNEKDKAETLNVIVDAVLKLKGVVSDETMLKVLVAKADLGVEFDVNEELAKVASERELSVVDIEAPFEE